MYQIDQSGKIEQTQVDTVIALANGSFYVVVLQKKTKRLLQALFRRSGKPEMFIYQTFAACLAIVLHEAKPFSKVIIDTEYMGQENLLHVLIEGIFDRLSWEKNYRIAFGFVGKQSPADHLAAKVARKKQKANKIITAEEIMGVMFARKKTGYSAINRTEGNLTQDWLPGDQKPSRSYKKIIPSRKQKVKLNRH